MAAVSLTASAARPWRARESISVRAWLIPVNASAIERWPGTCGNVTAKSALTARPVAGSVAVSRKAPRVSSDGTTVLPTTVGSAPK